VLALLVGLVSLAALVLGVGMILGPGFSLVALGALGLRAALSLDRPRPPRSDAR
jgi:hypothetical protein